jgi:hypothetical protein
MISTRTIGSWALGLAALAFLANAGYAGGC